MRAMVMRGPIGPGPIATATDGDAASLQALSAYHLVPGAAAPAAVAAYFRRTFGVPPRPRGGGAGRRGGVLSAYFRRTTSSPARRCRSSATTSPLSTPSTRLAATLKVSEIGGRFWAADGPQRAPDGAVGTRRGVSPGAGGETRGGGKPRKTRTAGRAAPGGSRQLVGKVGSLRIKRLPE
jgi:hypothetical protein